MTIDIEVPKEIQKISEMSAHLTVSTTSQRKLPFDPMRIYDSLLKETDLDKNTAKEITKKVVARINKIRFLSGPHIRELCCSILAEEGLENARMKYTRIGMPIHDYDQLINAGIQENSNQYRSPEAIHSWAADRMAKEYTWVKLLTPEQVNAHQSGVIHLHTAQYFDTRPFCQGLDARMVLQFGLPPVSGWYHTSNFRPARHANVASNHLSKNLVYLTNEFSGGLGYDNFNVFMAPIVAGLSFKEIKQVAQNYISEQNQIGLTRGGQSSFTSVTLIPEVPRCLKDIKAVKLGGKVGPETYADYEEEARRFLVAFIQVLKEGDASGRLFPFPKPEIKISKDWFRKYPDVFHEISLLTAHHATPYFLNQDQTGEESHSQCCRLINRKDEIKKYCQDMSLFDLNNHFLNLGSIQSVSLNLPRAAYTARGDDSRLFENIFNAMSIAKDILLIKRNLTIKRLESGLLPILSRKIGNTDQLFFDLRLQSLSIGFTGLNECLVTHLGLELHESQHAFDFGKKILRFMDETTIEFSADHQMKFSLWEQPAESSAGRFATLDLKEFPNKAVVLGDLKNRNVYYTNSGHLNYSANVSIQERILKQGEEHPIIKNGVITHVWLGESNPSPESLLKFIELICRNSSTYYFAFTKDFTICKKCGQNSSGLHRVCLFCNAPEKLLDYISRVTGYYALLSQFPNSKVEEWKHRYRYAL